MCVGLGVSVGGCEQVWSDMVKGEQVWISETDHGDGWYGYWVGGGMCAGPGVGVSGCGCLHRLVTPQII